MTYSFHPEAEVEFNNAIDYYEEYREGLGLKFASEIYEAIHKRIILHPSAWSS